jgi:hypothetical protein
MRLLLSSPARIENPRDAWKSSVITLPRDVREALESLESRMAREIYRQVAFGSPLSFAVAVYRTARIRFVHVSIDHDNHHEEDTHQFFVDAVSRDAYEIPLEKQEATLATVG